MVKGTLFVSHAQPSHQATVARTEAILRERFGDEFEFEVVDVLEDPARADAAHVLATPVLIIANGEGEQRFVGDVDRIGAARL